MSRRLTAREITTLALVSALIVLSKSVFRLPIHVPGHSGVFWMGLLVIGRGAVRRPTAGSLMGLVSGVLALALAPGREGMLAAVNYFIAGASLDLYLVLIGERLMSRPAAIAAGAVSNFSKLATSLLVGVALGVPGAYLAVGLGLAAVTHVAFGALGGLIGAIVLGRLGRTGLSQFEGLQPTVGLGSVPKVETGK